MQAGDTAPFAGKLVTTARLAKLVAMTEGLQATIVLNTKTYEEKLALSRMHLEEERAVFLESMTEQQKVVERALGELAKSQCPWWKEPALWIAAGAAAALLIKDATAQDG